MGNNAIKYANESSYIFQSNASYTKRFELLAFEEAFEQIKNDFKKQCENDQVIRLKALCITEYPSKPGWLRLKVLNTFSDYLQNRDKKHNLLSSRQIVVLCSHKPPRSNCLKWLNCKLNKLKKNCLKNNGETKNKQNIILTRDHLFTKCLMCYSEIINVAKYLKKPLQNSPKKLNHNKKQFQFSSYNSLL